MTPYYSDGQVTIYHGDCREAWPAVAAAVVCSPPYNVGVSYDMHDDRLPVAAYEALMGESCARMSKALASPGRAWVNVAPTVAMDGAPAGKHTGNTSAFRYPLLARWSDAMELAGVIPRDTVAWTSQRGSGTAWGSWQSPSAPNTRGDWEAIIAAYKGAWPRDTPAGCEGWRDEIGNWPALTSNVWEIRPEFRDAEGHPAPFPVEVASRCIRLSTWPGEVVVDPFMGSGSTLAAAVALGRKAVGIELSERYCEIAAKRLAQGALDFGGAA
jgi:site-specific DNA-methyltransferase (adenine-specific)